MKQLTDGQRDGWKRLVLRAGVTYFGADKKGRKQSRKIIEVDEFVYPSRVRYEGSFYGSIIAQSFRQWMNNLK